MSRMAGKTREDHHQGRMVGLECQRLGAAAGCWYFRCLEEGVQMAECGEDQEQSC